MTDKTLTLRKIYEYASEHLHILKLLFPSIFCWYYTDGYFVSETYIFSGVQLQKSAYIQSIQLPFITYGMTL